MSQVISGGQSPFASGRKETYILPSTVSPSHYDLVVKTDLLSSPPTFSGEIMIHIDVHEDVKELVFNLNDSLKVTHIAITSNDIKTSSSQTLDVSALSVDKELERATLDLSGVPGGVLKQAAKGAKVWMRFEAELGRSMVGYYESEGDLDEQTGKKPAYALTQFEPIAARRAFPCWDEPLAKATYSISMIGTNENVLLSNMPDISTKPWKAPSKASGDSVMSDTYEMGSLLGLPVAVAEGKSEGDSTAKTESGGASDGLKIVKFDKTPPISTYLIAYACGNFVHLSTEYKSSDGRTIPLRIFATKNQIKQAQFGLDIKKWALPVYEEIFDIPYALPKLDTLVANDFDAGAMENWGLITGRTTAYLYDPEKSPLSAKKRVATVQCHELAHMWFGDIVTMKWWDNLWLNESFATIMGELVIPDRIWPEWHVRREFLNSHLSNALTLDAQRSSHPIEMPCPDDSGIQQIFDSISYSKGASVLRMLSAVVGEEKFLKGVSLYLKKHLYGNAQTKDLWAGISEASGQDVAKLMQNWTLKVGFPIIKVEEVGDGKIKVTQNRFLSTGDAKPEEDETLWFVPLEITSLKDDKPSTDHSAVLHDRCGTFDVANSESFKLNGNTVGVYRVSYSPERLTKLGKEAHLFSVEDRVGLVSDAATLARAGYAKTSGSLNLVNELGKSETEFLPWAQIGAAVSKLSDVWWEQPEPVRKAISQLRIALFRPLVDKLGYENGADDAPAIRELRELAVTSAAAARDPEVLAELKKRFAPFLASGDDSRIPPDLQRTIYVNAIRHGGAEEYEKLIDVMKNPPNPSTKSDAMYALCAPEKPELVERSFKMMSNGTVKDQDLYIWALGLSGNHKARKGAAQWLFSNYDEMMRRFGDNAGISYMIKAPLNLLTSYEDIKMIKDFFKDKETKKYKLPLSQALDSIQAAADWLKRDGEDVEQWLKENKDLS